MKQLFILVAVATLTLTFSSCSKEKDYTCTCTLGGVETPTVLEDMTKSEAETACEALDLAAQIGGGSCSLD